MLENPTCNIHEKKKNNFIRTCFAANILTTKAPIGQVLWLICHEED